MQSLHLQQSQSLRQEQILAPQQIQSLEILLATQAELEQKISDELIDNPTLEMLDPGNTDLAGNPVEEGGETGREIREMGDSDLSQKLESVLQIQDLWQDRQPGPGSRTYTEEDEERRQFFFDSLVDQPSVQEVLLTQLREIGDLDETRQRICEEIVGSIDDSGYLRSHLADIAIACGEGDFKQVESCLKLIQGFDPPGIGARDLRECLLLQLERLDAKGTLAWRVVDKYLPEVGRNQFEQVCKGLRASAADVREALQTIRQLHPHPGTLIAPTATSDFILPEVFIEKDDAGEWIVRTNRDSVPRLRLSPQYVKMLGDENTPEEVRNYIRQKIGDSKNLMRALEQRESTIMRIARCLLRWQRGFFDHGLSAMKPLTMAQLAEDLEIHETTVSRAIANKYVMTPHGIFPFRIFFSTGYTTRDGDEVSNVVVKERLRHLLEQESPAKPLSDRQLADRLKKEGYDVARRTVAKYREELGFPTSSLRRRF